jgi:hypothetical protein
MHMAAENLSADRPAPGAGGPVWARLLPAGSRPARRVLIGGVLAGYCWVAGGSAPLTSRALITVLIPAAVLGLIAFARPPQRIPPPESVDIAGFSYWLVAIALLFEWEASSVRDNSPAWHPSLTDLINPLLAPHPVRSAAFGLWLLSGWALVKR